MAAMEAPGICPAPGSADKVLVALGSAVWKVLAGRDSSTRSPRTSFAKERTEAERWSDLLTSREHPRG